jgi:hypothetical protein
VPRRKIDRGYCNIAVNAGNTYCSLIMLLVSSAISWISLNSWSLWSVIWQYWDISLLHVSQYREFLSWSTQETTKQLHLLLTTYDKTTTHFHSSDLLLWAVSSLSDSVPTLWYALVFNFVHDLLIAKNIYRNIKKWWNDDEINQCYVHSWNGMFSSCTDKHWDNELIIYNVLTLKTFALYQRGWI